MRNRCHNPKYAYYHQYGGRGIKICDEWDNPDTGSTNFIHWALESGYEEGLTLDRIDNDGNYCPENCRWADDKLQSNNKNNCRYLLWHEYVFTIAIWVEICGIPRNTFLHRLERGWSIDESLRTPSGAWYKRGQNMIDLVIDPKYDKYNKYEEFKAKGILDTCTYP